MWGVLIGLILIYLSAGYVIGGRLADRHPRDEILYQITAWAGLWIGLIPLVSYPILLASQQGFKDLSAGLVAGTLLAVVLLFAAPVILLGCVSPFVIRLLLKDVETGGNTAGRVYALSTAGSILGTFLPVFWFIPTYGTRPTLIGFGLAQVLISVAGLWPRRRLRMRLFAADRGPRPDPPAIRHQAARGRLARVREGVGLQLHPGRAGRDQDRAHPQRRPGGSLDLRLAEQPDPRLLGLPSARELVRSRASCAGDAALGCLPRPRRAAPPRGSIDSLIGDQIDITGVEIDPDILAVGHRYFHLDDARAHEVVADARYWLDTQAGHYDVIVLDAYRQPYIPFHLTTREFFQQLKAHLNPGGVIAVNVGRTATDYRLVDALASTMAAVFPSVLLLDDPNYKTPLSTRLPNRPRCSTSHTTSRWFQRPLRASRRRSALDVGKLRMSPYHGQVYTDDLAPIEQLIDQIIFSYVTGR